MNKRIQKIHNLVRDGRVEKLVVSLTESKRAYFINTVNYATRKHSVLSFPKAMFDMLDATDRFYSEFDMFVECERSRR